MLPNHALILGPRQPETIMQKTKRVVFTQGGKGGVGKTEVMLGLIDWYASQGLSPALLDFDIENTNKSGLQNFHPSARKFDVHTEGALDEFFDICDSEETGIVLADLGAGAGAATYQWFDDAHEDATEFGIRFTAVGVTTNEAGAVQSILKWAHHLQDRVDYLIVQNEFRERNSDFAYWNSEPAVERFRKTLDPRLMRMKARIQEFQAELRNRSATLQQVIDGTVDTDFFKRSKNLFRARSYQRELFAGFDEAADILLPNEA